MRPPTRISDCSATTRVDLTPMIDVVFLLIIFFLVSSHMARQENRPPIELTVATTGTSSDPSDGPLNLTIDSKGRIHLASTILALDQFPSAFQTWKSIQKVANPIVRVRVDQSITYANVEPVLAELAQSGISDVSLSVIEKR